MRLAQRPRMGTPRVAIVGAGRMGLRHAYAFTALGLPVIGVDDNPWARATFADHSFDVVQKLEEAVGACSHIVVATPNASHVSVALAALDYNLPLLVEKPISLDLVEAGQLVSAFGAKQVPLFVAHSERFHPAVSCVRGALGTEPIAEARFVRMGPTQTTNVSPLLTHAIHDFDLARWLLGTPLRMATVKKVNDAEIVELVSEKGVRVSIASGVQREPRRALEIRTRTRTLIADLVTSKVTINDVSKVLAFRTTFGLEAQARAFAILSPELATGADGLVALALATEAAVLSRDRATHRTMRDGVLVHE